MSNLDFRLQPIGELIVAGRLHVPRNQRDYFWEVEHVKDLCNDFADAIREGKESYFLGTIVLTSSKSQGFEVVDGQQRLVTTTIILAAIRDIFFQLGDIALMNHTESEFLFKYDRDTEQIVPKLSLNVKDDVLFRETLLTNPKGRIAKSAKPLVAPSNRRLVEATAAVRKYFEEVLQPVAAPSKKRVLNRWLDFIESGAQVIVLKVPDTGNAYMMFETLNDRGLKVSQADLVKNYLFGKAGEGDRRQEVEDKWSSMTAVLESVGEQDVAIDYLRFVCSMLFDLTRNVFDRIKGHVSSKQRAVEFAHTLEELSHDYEAMLRSDHPKWNNYPVGIRRSIRTLNLFDVTQIRHLMLAVAHHFTPIETARAFELFVNWIVRLFIAGAGRVGRVESKYASLAHTIHTKQTIKTAEQLGKEMRKYVPPNDEFQHAFAVARVSQAKLARYYLDRLQRRDDKKNKRRETMPSDDTTELNLEHVIPLNCVKEKWPDLQREDAEALYGRIGNMALLDAVKNSKIGNVGFAEKKQAFANSMLSLTKMVAENNSWGADEVNKRQQVLAKLAVETWPLRAS